MDAANTSIKIKKKDIIRQFLPIFLPLALFLSCVAALFSYRDMNSSLESLQRSEEEKVTSQVKLLRSKFQAISTDLRLLALRLEFSEYLKNPNRELRQKIENDLLLFSRIKNSFSRVELIDTTGEKLTVIQSVSNKFIILADKDPGNILMDPCLTRAMKLPVGTIQTTTSTCGRNPQDDPVLRYSTTITDNNGTTLGLIVLTQPISQFIQELQTLSGYSLSDVLLVSPEGIILGNNIDGADRTFPQENSSANIKDIIPAEWKQIEKTVSGQLLTSIGLLTYNTLYPLQGNTGFLQSSHNTLEGEFLWKEISHIQHADIHKQQRKNLGRILISYLLALLLLAVGTLLLAGTAVRRKIAEQSAREKAEEIQAINETAANAIIAFDNKRNIVHWNPAAESLFQYSEKEVLEKPITEIIAPSKQKSDFLKLSRKLNIKQNIPRERKTIELYGHRKDGSTFPLDVSFSSFKKDGQWHTVGVFRDISYRVNMEKEILRANKFESLSVLSSGIAHDFNDLLTAIVGNINLAGKLSGTSPESLELLQNAEKAAGRAKRLTQQLLTFSKNGVLIRRTTAVEDVLRDGVDYALHGSSIVSGFSIAKDLLLVDIDSSQIGQVIRNIVTNARQAIPNSGAINIICRNVTAEETEMLPEKFSGRYIEIAIHDTGIGIPADSGRKIFDPYFTTKDHGSGLGLTIADAIIQQHDGYITYFSRENVGTTFYVFLPAAVDQQLPGEKEKKRGAAKHLRILVIDDEDMLLHITGRMLTHLGHESIPARSAREALGLYRHHWKTGPPIDGVIIDLTLSGGMGGKETAGAIFDINAEARIIVSSGYANDPVMVDYDEYGFCAAIAKPFDMAELEEIINDVLG